MTQPFDDVTVGPGRTAMTPGGTTPLTAGPSRFAPGAIVAGRYRLVALLGRGGMGEVYRADDLTLDQPVALKFLPEGVGSGDTRVAQFHNELRVARQVSHKNVCRLYDLGEADGRRFLTMEYVDGEDLSSSLRRFGRIPSDKAVQIARQLCAGITAAHEKGVLHRDLKPANVMLDGNGDVRITDFGIATLGGDATDIAGTPQYMAPELLAGKPASVKSDIYALGLILFEIFTGKRVYEAKTLGELKQLHDTGTVTTPSSIIHDLDPAVERVILRCLEKDPEKRPASALTIAASLPGSDPLAAALAAGETPSPELLVAAGESEAMRVGPALAMTVGFIVVLLASVGSIARGSAIGRVSMEIPRDAMADRARQVIRKLGFTGTMADRALGYGLDRDHLRWIEKNGSKDWWNEVQTARPSPVTFWYRTSPREMEPVSPTAPAVDIADPPVNVPGMQQLMFDSEGRLTEYHAVPPADATIAPAAAPPWDTIFEAADLDAKSLTSTAPRWTPRDFADATAAWEGPMPGRAGQRIRVEAASFRNHLVSFQIFWPWTDSSRPEEPPRTGLQKATDALSIVLWVTFLLGAVLLARHNLRLNRADRRGAARFAIAMTLASLGGRLLAAMHSANPSTEIGQIFMALLFAVFTGGMTWVFYLAIEPYARRFWPDALLAWSRLLSGRLRDPRVGRELLIGLSLGAAALVIVEVPKLLTLSFGWRLPPLPFGNALWVLVGVPALLGHWLVTGIGALQSGLTIAMIFLVLRLLLKRPRLALGVGLAVLLLAMNSGSVISGTWIDRYNVIVFTLLITIAIHRFGLLAAATLLFVDNIITDVPMTTNLSAWWSTPTILSVGLLIGLAGFAYYAARAGQPLFGHVLSD